MCLATKLLGIQFESTVKDMRGMRFISICALFVMLGLELFNTSLLSKN